MQTLLYFSIINNISIFFLLLKITTQSMKLLLLITIFIFSNTDIAHGHADKEHDLDSSQFLNLQFENDLFGDGADNHFTHGTRISCLTKKRPTHFQNKLKSTLLAAAQNFLIPKTCLNHVPAKAF